MNCEHVKECMVIRQTARGVRDAVKVLGVKDNNNHGKQSRVKVSTFNKGLILYILQQKQ